MFYPKREIRLSCFFISWEYQEVIFSGIKSLRAEVLDKCLNQGHLMHFKTILQKMERNVVW